MRRKNNLNSANLQRMYVHQLKNWPHFTWNLEEILPQLSGVHKKQGYIIGQMKAMGFKIQEATLLDTLTLDVVKSSEIEGEQLNADQVRSPIARRLGIEIVGAVEADRNVEGVVEMMLDSTQHYADALTTERLFNWHAALFPTGRSGMHKITVAAWRTAEADPVKVVSGPMGGETVHFEAPHATLLPDEMPVFFSAEPHFRQITAGRVH